MVRSAPITEGEPLLLLRAAGPGLGLAGCGDAASLGGPGLASADALSLSGFFVNIYAPLHRMRPHLLPS